MNLVLNPPKVRQSVDGLLLLDKPIGLSSNRALQKVKRLFNAKKAGHSGSLDPLANGLLPLCFGHATKFSAYLLESDKSYEVKAQLGIRTDSADAEGQVIATRSVPNFESAFLEKALIPFRGAQKQIPSMFSAIKLQGQPLYVLARQGIEVPRAARDIHIYALELVHYEAPTLTLKMHCSKGTYVRTLVDDLGEALGCGAHVTYLRRTHVGPFKAHDMVTMDVLENASEQEDNSGLMDLLKPINTMLEHLPSLLLNDALLFYLQQGQAVFVPHAPSDGWVQLKNKAGRFLGVGEVLDDGRIAPRRLTA